MMEILHKAKRIDTGTGRSVTKEDLTETLRWMVEDYV